MIYSKIEIILSNELLGKLNKQLRKNNYYDRSGIIEEIIRQKLFANEMSEAYESDVINEVKKHILPLLRGLSARDFRGLLKHKSFADLLRYVGIPVVGPIIRKNKA